MIDDSESPFPDDLSDEVATQLCDLLHQLAMAAEYRYLTQILRYRKKHRPPHVDPDHPWLSKL